MIRRAFEVTLDFGHVSPIESRSSWIVAAAACDETPSGGSWLAM
jgi:hypothetical protein